ncbi:outer membrane protein assembly factor BamD [Acinetobacter kookii]|uniref:Outer membrane protein assembly factor BamD n=1 Tax=Acinetobacter kookii TaxID=1226327 RepID=A0A1G6KIG0_9GAMM|nr:MULTISPECIES: outer membrane protein assembly factor BamD [Acinetobacter]MCT8089007.1 outer membrane protein assembly factor BamD [Acinetobacter sp. F_3_1]MCT8097162.1 outer membrane protein assembly factor BamD [Acinetobacter sp. C_3_1]MCT8099845.1 outer membrane protein assembly factor BamD [Acinetobacter sp. C_4_1]MCT8134245.1 outer membrane protein assembly factor BamD [Acinetobacter sp. T_3_1]SDC30601.1 Beta-barrel assembly machine subunit BamD [Acinetobacter kookii]
MSLPRYKMTMLALSLGVASAIVGCSSNPKKEVVDTGPQSSEQVYIQKAEKALERGQYTDAAKHLEAIDTYYPTGDYAQQAQLELLYVKFQQKDYEGAVALAERFIRLNPQHPNVDYAYYVRGVANMEQNYDGLLRYTSLKQSHRDVSYLKVAYQNFVDFIRRFPSSTYAVDAAQRMKFIGTELAESEMNAARFNIKRKAWLAAIERSQWVVEHYPQTPQIPEALATMAYGYDKLGDQQTSQQYIEVLKLNYPHLVKADGSVNMRAAHNEGSWVNRATLGIFGREAKTSTEAEQQQISEQSEKRSLTNRLSFGLLDRPKTESSIPAAPEQQPQAETPTPAPGAE